MAFKMKAGKEGPMKKNFPGAFKQQNTVELADGQSQAKATEAGIMVKGPGGKVSKYGVDDPGYAGAKQAYIDAGGESPYTQINQAGVGGMAAGRRVKPGVVDIDGNYIQSGYGRRTYTE